MATLGPRHRSARQKHLPTLHEQSGWGHGAPLPTKPRVHCTDPLGPGQSPGTDLQSQLCRAPWPHRCTETKANLVTQNTPWDVAGPPGAGGRRGHSAPPPSGANTGWRPRRAHQRAGVQASLPSAEQHRCLLNCCLERAPAVVCVCTPRLLCGNLPPIVVFGVPLEVLRSQGWSPMSGTSALKKGPRRACSLTPLLPPTLLSPAPEPWEVSGVMRKPRSPDFVTAVPVDRVASCPLPVSRKAWPQRLPVQLSHPYTLGNQCSSDKATTGAGPGSGLHQESCHVGRVWLH